MAAYKPRPKPTLVGTVKKTTAGLGRGQTAKPLPKPGAGKPNLNPNQAKAAKLRAALGKPIIQETRHVGPAPRAEEDAGYVNRVDDAEAKGEERLGALGNQEQDIKRDFGIDDPTDPFSRANGLKNAFLARMKAASAGLASQGQLYSGAHERAISRTRREEEEARAELRKSYEAAIGQVGSEKAGVKWATEEEKNQAFEDWLARAPEAEVEVSEDEVGKAYSEEEAGKINQALMPAAKPAPASGAPIPSMKESAEARKRRERQEKKAKEIVKRVGEKRAIKKGKVELRGTVVGGRAGGGGMLSGSATKPKAKAKPKGKAKGKGKGR